MAEKADRFVYRDPRTNPLRALSAVFWLALFIVVAVWAAVALSVGDALWFLPTFQGEASAISLYWDGQYTRVLPDTPEYQLFQEALSADLAQVQSYARGTGLSDETLEDLRQRGRLIEVYYDQPTRLHTMYSFGASEVYYIPLSGFNAEQNRVYNAGRGAPVELVSMEQILAAAGAVARQRGMDSP